MQLRSRILGPPCGGNLLFAIENVLTIAVAGGLAPTLNLISMQLLSLDWNSIWTGVDGLVC